MKKRRLSALYYVVFIAVLLTSSVSGQAGDSDLISKIADRLLITKEQATGGAGAIFEYAKQNLSADDFATIAKGVPDMDELLAAAPKGASDSALGKPNTLTQDSMISTGSVGGLSGLASSFESLGLDAALVKKFVPIMSDYVGSVSGEQAMALLQGLF